MCQISFIVDHTEYINITENHENIRVWTKRKVKGTDYLEGLGIDGRWDLGRDPPRTHCIYQNVLFLLSALFPVM